MHSGVPRASLASQPHQYYFMNNIMYCFGEYYITFSYTGTPCTALPNKSPYTTVTSSDSGNYNVVVVTGISNDQETMCNITLECQQCFPNSKIEHNIIEPCASSNTFCDVAKGTYTLTTTVFNSCGETFAIEPSHEIIVGKFTARPLSMLCNLRNSEFCGISTIVAILEPLCGPNL